MNLKVHSAIPEQYLQQALWALPGTATEKQVTVLAQRLYQTRHIAAAFGGACEENEGKT